MKTKHALMSEFSSLKTIVAVSKTQPIEAIQKAIEAGYSDFGENKAQELKEKAQVLPDLTWHFIGHLQTNKVKDVIKYASTIHSVDSLKLIEAIDKECFKKNKAINIYIQVNLTQEDQKSGCDEKDLIQLIEKANASKMIHLIGLMVMGPSSVNLNETRLVFKKAKHLLIQLQKDYPNLTELSMGMSQDYQIAIEEGASTIRIGSTLFGKRN